MPETPPSQFRLSRLSKKRLKALAAVMDKPESEIVELAITHFSGTLARDLPFYATVPDEDSEPPKAHKAGHRAS